MLALFPGQGAQHVGMAKELFDNFAIAREIFEEGSDAIKVNLKKLCFDGPESDLVLTENTQPALLTASVAAFRVAEKEHGLVPTLVAGHSLGEYSALVAAGALPYGSAMRWVRERGRAMQIAVPAGQGTMAAILGLDEASVRSLCEAATRDAVAKRESRPEITVDSVVEPANFNSPGQVVIAGSVDAVEEAQALIKSGAYPGGKAMPLSVSAPFHCRLMKPARDRMAEIFSKAVVTPGALSCPYLPNRTARVTGESGVIFELLVEQVDHPVLWEQSMKTAMQAGHARAVEFGPGKVLQGLAKRIAKATSGSLEVLSVGNLDSVKELGAFLTIK